MGWECGPIRAHQHKNVVCPSHAIAQSRNWQNLAHANCTPFFSPKHLDFVTEKNSFFCHLENTVFQTLPKNAFFISFAHFSAFFRGVK